MKKGIFTCLFIAFALTAAAQLNELDSFNQSREILTRNGMYVLGSWALGNMAVSGALYFNTSGETRYFHQMNVFWNVVNAGLAAGGIFFQNDMPEGLSATLAAQQQIEKVLLFNAGLDVGYMATGLFLLERGKRVNKNAELFRGYGKSLILQGAFLFLFDLGFYHFQHKNGEQLNPFLDKIELSDAGLGLKYRF